MLVTTLKGISNMYEPDSVHRLANKPNHKGYTPLYIACKNGNLEVQILYKCNIYLIFSLLSYCWNTRLIPTKYAMLLVI